MNIRFSDQQIRFRTTREEFAKLLAGERIQTKTILPDETSLTFLLKIAEKSILKRNKDAILLGIEKSQAKKLDTKTPRKEGITLILGEKSGTPLKAIIEVDVFKKPTE